MGKVYEVELRQMNVTSFRVKAASKKEAIERVLNRKQAGGSSEYHIEDRDCSGITDAWDIPSSAKATLIEEQQNDGKE